MRKKIIVSILAVLIMLMSLPLVFQTVKSIDYTTGDAYIGTFWVSELDVSGTNLETVDFIGIAHANASDQWVVWVDGDGYVKANWTVDIGNNHPEYYVQFTIDVFNADNNGEFRGSDTFYKKYDANTSYDESGTLSTSLSFSQSEQQLQEQTLVGYLSAVVVLVNTTEAKNFSVMAEDRSIIGVGFDFPRGESFGPFITEANDKEPPEWSGVDEWNQQSRFENVEDQMCNQTLVISGKKTFTAGTTQHNPDWYIGDLDIWENENGGFNFTWTLENQNITWDYHNSTGYLDGYGIINWTIHWNPLPIVHLPFFINFRLWSSEPDPSMRATNICPFILKFCLGDSTSSDELKKPIHSNIDYDEGDEDGIVDLYGFLRVWHGRMSKPEFNPALQIIIGNGTGDQVSGGSNPFSWHESLAYIDSIDISLSGTSEISVDIEYGLYFNNEGVYVYSGERGDTTVVLTV